MAKFDIKKFLMTGLVGIIAFGFIGQLLGEIEALAYSVAGIFTIAGLIAFGIAFWIAEFIYQKWG